jgi:Putative zinc-finger
MTTDAPHLQTEQLSALLDRQLPPAEQQRAEQHLATCPDCGEELERLRATVGLLRELPQVEPPRVFSLPATTLRSGPRSSLALRLVPWTRAAGALAALFVVLLSVDLLTTSSTGQPALAPTSEPRPALAPAAESRGAVGQPATAAQPAEGARAAAPAAPSADGAAFQAKQAQGKAAPDSATSDTSSYSAAPSGGAQPTAGLAQPAPAARAAAPLPAATPPPAATPGLAPTAGPTLTSPPAAVPAAPLTTTASRVSTLRGWQIASGVLAVTLVLIALLLPRLAQRSR